MKTRPMIQSSIHSSPLHATTTRVRVHCDRNEPLHTQYITNRSNIPPLLPLRYRLNRHLPAIHIPKRVSARKIQSA